jgi:EAL domain-containing protein (putative c-di-GMP-specific phosphodiesterase class I)
LPITTASPEGVETEEQLSFLTANGCDEAQGFYFARPQAPAELSDWLNRESRTREAHALASG